MYFQPNINCFRVSSSITYERWRDGKAFSVPPNKSTDDGASRTELKRPHTGEPKKSGGGSQKWHHLLATPWWPDRVRRFIPLCLSSPQRRFIPLSRDTSYAWVSRAPASLDLDRNTVYILTICPSAVSDISLVSETDEK